MSGVIMEIDANLRKQVEAILAEHGLIKGAPEMTYEQALEEFEAFLEKGRNSPISPLSTDEIFDNLIARNRARR